MHKFRFWHIIYVNTAVVIQNLALSKIQPSESNVKEIWDVYQESIMKTRHRLNIENLTLIAFLLVTFIPFDFLIYLLIPNLWLIVLVHVILMVFIYLVCYYDLEGMLSRGYKASWMLKLDLIQIAENEKNPG